MMLPGLILAFVAAAAQPAPPIEASMQLAPPIIPYHRQAELRIEVTAAKELPLNLPDVAKLVAPLTLVGPLEAPQTESLPDGRKRVVARYKLDAIWPGDYPIAPLELTPEEGAPIVVPGPVLRVRELTDEERGEAMQFVPIAGPMAPPVQPWRTWWFWAIVAAAAALVVSGGWYLWRSRAFRAAAPPPRPAWEVAYERLESLDKQQLPEAGKHGPYYVELSTILREYIEARFQLHAPEETTQEFIADASRSGVFSDEHQKLLALFLRHCDRVKFAQYEPSLAEMEQGFAEVLRFIDETVPAAEAPDKEAAA